MQTKTPEALKMSLLDVDDETFRPIPAAHWRQLWNNAEEVYEKITMAMILSKLQCRRMQLELEHADNG